MVSHLDHGDCLTLIMLITNFIICIYFLGFPHLMCSYQTVHEYTDLLTIYRDEFELGSEMA